MTISCVMALSGGVLEDRPGHSLGSSYDFQQAVSDYAPALRSLCGTSPAWQRVLMRSIGTNALLVPQPTSVCAGGPAGSALRPDAHARQPDHHAVAGQH